MAEYSDLIVQRHRMKLFQRPSPQANDPQSQIEAVKQRVVRKSRAFSLLPIVILHIVMLDLAWEILRQFMETDKWPWSITFLGVTPAASLCGVFAALVFARGQFARSVRPSLSWRTSVESSAILNGLMAWNVRLMNAGPGLGQVESVKYTVAITAEAGLLHSDLRHQQAIEILDRAGLQSGQDYFLDLVTAGFPLPPVKNAAEGLEFAAFTLESLEKIVRLDFVIRVVDTVGDTHEKALPGLATVPPRLTKSPLATAKGLPS